MEQASSNLHSPACGLVPACPELALGSPGVPVVATASVEPTQPAWHLLRVQVGDGDEGPSPLRLAGLRGQAPPKHRSHHGSTQLLSRPRSLVR